MKLLENWIHNDPKTSKPHHSTSVSVRVLNASVNTVIIHFTFVIHFALQWFMGCGNPIIHQLVVQTAFVVNFCGQFSSTEYQLGSASVSIP